MGGKVQSPKVPGNRAGGALADTFIMCDNMFVLQRTGAVMQVLESSVTFTKVPENARVEEKRSWTTPTFHIAEISEVTKLGGPPLIFDGFALDLIS